eukprot:TRINITY_DN8750_c0_g1_i1.p1 TRINITY_DN8750_c0_g1~~TRINITY_DN8750_c0_g1_i1.p1  ORF type:complete len:304 (-),score=40.12 TRINITY_DN8750_c0_g1_i1:229-1140(-)
MYIEECRQYKWCPNPSCSLLTEIKDESQISKQGNIRCRCATLFCSKCSSEGHLPLACDAFVQWKYLNKGKYGNISDKGIRLNTKSCPYCKINIQKNQGCMHMTCSQCRHEFCWICLGDWKQHGAQSGGFYQCNKFQESERIQNEQKQSEEDLKKFAFYSERFVEHLKSVKNAEVKLPKAISSLKSISDSLSIPCEDTHFLEEAITLVIECRRMIAFTYPLFYFTEFRKETFKEISFLQLGLLQQVVETLDKKTDELLNAGQDDNSKFTVEKLIEFKHEIQRMTKSLKKNFENLISHLLNPKFQ